MAATQPSAADLLAPAAPAGTTLPAAGPPAGTAPAMPFADVLDRQGVPEGRSTDDHRDGRPRTGHAPDLDPAVDPGGAPRPRAATAADLPDPSAASPVLQAPATADRTPGRGPHGAAASADRPAEVAPADDGSGALPHQVDLLPVAGLKSGPAVPAGLTSPPRGGTAPPGAAPAPGAVAVQAPAPGTGGTPVTAAVQAPPPDTVGTPGAAAVQAPAPGTVDPPGTAAAPAPVIAVVPARGSVDVAGDRTPSAPTASDSPTTPSAPAASTASGEATPASSVDGTPAGAAAAVPADRLVVPAPVPSAPPIPTVATPVAAPSPEAGPDLQLLSASLLHTLDRGDGEYSVTVSMHPPELGEVRALLSLRGDVLQVVLTPHEEVGHGTLATALPALRDHLASSGLRVDVSFGHPGSDSGPDRGPAARSTATVGAGHDGEPHQPPVAVSPTVGADSDTRIHLVL